MFREHFRYIKSYISLAKPSKPLFVINFITAAGYKILNLLQPFAAALIIKALTNQDSEATVRSILLFSAITIAYYLVHFLNYKTYSWNYNYIYRQLQQQIFQKLLTVDQNFTRGIDKGRLMNTINSDLSDVSDMNDDISEYTTTIAQIVIVCIIVAYYNLPVAIIIVATTLIYLRIADHADRKYNFYWWKTMTDNDKYSNFINQTLSGLSEIKVFNLLPSLKSRLNRLQKHHDKNYRLQRHYRTFGQNDTHAIFYLVKIVLYLILIFAMVKGYIAIDILILLIAYHESVGDYADTLRDYAGTIRLAGAAVERTRAILNYHPSENLEFGDLDLDQLSGRLSLKNVSLKLNNKPILKNLNLNIRRHEFIAITGFPGAGKTMLFNLILRLNKPTKGKITLDDIDIQKFSKQVYTSNVSVANQIPFVFNLSIRKNLDFVDPDIKHQIEACKIVGIHNFIETLPQGYNTILRENGSNISADQKQLISIARAILTDAEILLFDDVTTSMDRATAKTIPKLIKRLEGQRTVIMITKNPDLLMGADRIVVMDDGKIVDVGTHAGLMKRSRLYRDIQAGSISQLTSQGAKK